MSDGRQTGEGERKTPKRKVGRQIAEEWEEGLKKEGERERERGMCFVGLIIVHDRQGSRVMG
jgi:hypothetical protein